ncbi:MAG TPA: hypothetical protein VJL38_01060 [Patescibacteria group bacterium]|nr:hypothetical protein [Patescibacteria group bacterium]
MRETIEFLKSAPKKVQSAARKAFFEHSENPQSLGNHWDKLIRSDTGNSDRVTALFSIIRSTVPDAVFNPLTSGSFVMQIGLLPIDYKQYAFEKKRIGAGGACTVFKLVSQDPDKPSLVVKIDQTETDDVEQLLKRGKELRDTYEEQKSWYAAIHGFIPDEFQFIAQNPRGGEKAIFTIQKFFGNASRIQDVFRDIPKDEFLTLLREDERLAETFRLFASITIAQAEQYDRMIDTLGDKNVSLVNTENGKRLILLDPHTTYHPSQEELIKRNALRADITYLKNTLALMDRARETTPLVA